MKEIKVKCIDCGREFTITNKRKRLCPICVHEHALMAAKAHKERQRIEKLKKKLSVRNERLLHETIKADKLGVSYGKFKAMQKSGVVA